MWGLVWGDCEVWRVPMGVLGLPYALSTSGRCGSLEGGHDVKCLAKSQVLQVAAGHQSPDATGSTLEQVNQGAALPRLSFTSNLGRPVQGGQSNHQWQLPLDPGSVIVHVVAYLVLGGRLGWDQGVLDEELQERLSLPLASFLENQEVALALGIRKGCWPGLRDLPVRPLGTEPSRGPRPCL